MKVIAVVSAKGGVGKTTLAANLASVLATSGRRVIALDLDPQNRCVCISACRSTASTVCRAPR
jgi:ATPases involved in chromosome partitioning